jgi:hypothetical protein
MMTDAGTAAPGGSMPHRTSTCSSDALPHTPQLDVA